MLWGIGQMRNRLDNIYPIGRNRFAIGQLPLGSWGGQNNIKITIDIRLGFSCERSIFPLG